MDRLEAIRHVMATIFSAQNALRTLAPEFSWAGMGNLLGDYGELVCLETYNLTKAPAGANGFDAIDDQGRTVQIKANHASQSIGLRGNADLLLVIHVDDKGNHDEVYFGDYETVIQNTQYSGRDNKRTITISKLRRMNLAKD